MSTPRLIARLLAQLLWRIPIAAIRSIPCAFHRHAPDAEQLGFCRRCGKRFA
jgi:hypothetical protein